MISPYVRRLRLAQELVRLREDRGWTIALLVANVESTLRMSSTKVSYLENASRRPDPTDVMGLLKAFGVDATPERWAAIMRIAEDASDRGWWASSAKQMGQRQALYANLEAGAATIEDYQMTYLPGLLQTQEYIETIRALAKADAIPSAEGTTSKGMLRGRLTRQRMLHRPDGPMYRVIVDELAIRRLSAPPKIGAAQLRVLAQASGDKIEVRVLPLKARIEGYSVPRSAFSVYSTADKGDPVIAIVDTVTEDRPFHDPAQVGPYREMWRRLHDAALPVQDSADLIEQAALEMESDS